MADQTVNPPSTEAGPWDKPFLEWTVADGLAAWHGPTCRDDAAGCACPCHQPMPEQARAEGRREADEAIGLLQEVRNSDVIFPRSDWPLSQAIAAFLDNLAKGGVAGLNASEQPPMWSADAVGQPVPTCEERGHVHRHPTGSPFYHDECDITDRDASESGQPPEAES